MVFNLNDLMGLAAGINPNVKVHMVLGAIIALGLLERTEKKEVEAAFVELLHSLATEAGRGDQELTEALFNEWTRKIEHVFNAVR